MNGVTAALPPFQAPYAQPDEELAARFLTDAVRELAAERRVDARARRLVEAIRAKIGGKFYNIRLDAQGKFIEKSISEDQEEAAQ